MTVSWKLWMSLCHVCSALLTGVMLQEDFNLEPLNSTALRGSTVRFQATVQRSWGTMFWKVGDANVLTIDSDNKTTSFSEQYSARLSSNGSIDRVEFNIHNVTRERAGPVSCSLLGIAGEKTAQLEVQESGSVLIAGGNRTAGQNQQVEFQCQAAAWFPAPSLTWTRNGHSLDSSLFSTNSTPQGNSINSVSVLKFQADSSTTVQCLAALPTLPTPMSSSVFLEVVPDWTVLIAVVTSIGGFALLVLLIIMIVFCHRRRKERKPNYNDDMMRARTQSQLSGVELPGRRRGTVNEAYVSDKHTSETPPGDVTDSRYNIKEMPDIVSSSQVGSSGQNVVDSGFIKHRHMTIV